MVKFYKKIFLFFIFLSILISFFIPFSNFLKNVFNVSLFLFTFIKIPFNIQIIFFIFFGLIFFFVSFLSLKQLSILGYKNLSKFFIFLMTIFNGLFGLNYFFAIILHKGIFTLLISNLLIRRIVSGIFFGIFPIILCIWLFIQVFIKKNLIDKSDD